MVLAVIALCFAAGVFTLQLFAHLPQPLWLLGLPLCVLGLLRYRALACVWVYILGFCWALLQAHWHFYHALPASLIAKDILIEGRISSIVQREGRSQRFELIIEKHPPSNLPFPRKIRLSVYQSGIHLKAGQRWRFKVRLKPPHGFANPGGFDYERWLYMGGIQATGYVRKDKRNHLLGSGGSIARLRQFLFTQISAKPRPFNGVLAALLVGDKSAISQQQWQVFRHTGTSHLMAISGLHIGLVAGLVFFLVRRLCPVRCLRYISAQQYGAVFSLLAAFGYALLAGFSVPTQRALIMLTVVLGGIIVKRAVRPWQALSLALLAVLVVDSRALLSAGFYLSFAAVAVIVYGIYGRLGHGSRWLQTMAVQWRLSLLLLPLTLLWFQQGSLISPLANILLVPWVGLLVVPVALLSLIFTGWLQGLADGLLNLANTLLSLSWPILQTLADWPFGHFTVAAIPLWAVVLALAGGLILLAPRGFPLRWLGALWLLPALTVAHYPPPEGSFRLTLLDVGQGLSVFVQTRHHGLIYDTGPSFSASFNTGDRVILPYLQYRGVHHLDKLIISHGDRDHIGGAQAVLDQMPVWQLEGQGISRLHHPYPQACQQGQSWRWDGVLFEVLHPDGDYPRRNNRGCVVKISTQGSSVLLTADIEKKVEGRLLQQYGKALDVNVLLIPHHGSNTSSSRDFIAATSPQLALVSAGFANRFGHPRKPVLETYRAFDVPVYNTAREGAIELIFTPQGYQLSHRQRRDAPHYWQNAAGFP